MKLISALFLTFCTASALVSCNQSKPKEEAGKEPGIDPKIAVTCDGIGPVLLKYTHEDLAKQFNDTSLAEHANTEKGNYTSIWEGKPEQVNVYWKEKSAPFTHIASIETVFPESQYEAKGGLRTGLTMKEIQAINSNMPLTFVNPYAATDPGLITTFNNGQLATENPCIGGYVEISKTRNVDQPTLQKFSNEKVVDGTHILFQERITAVFARFKVSAK